jgi:3-hydroxyacyl-CoA dehydrogenase/enoyl-CoA hydratase/3-hydroxybutyryl-CoA epimerase
MPAIALTLPKTRKALPAPHHSIYRTVDEFGICRLIFDRPNSSANIFDEATLTELHDHIRRIEENPDIRGVIISSAKDHIFIAGADIHSVLSDPDQEKLDWVIALGQTVFKRLSNLSIPTVAAIHGACVGGGYELTLACDWRIATPDKETKLGLPEVQLGIIPAWGGSTRLPRLIGLPKALNIILNGKTPPANLAKKLGMIDDIVYREKLDEVAHDLIKEGKPQRDTFPLLNSRITALIARLTTRSKLDKNYPALLETLNVVTRGISLTEGDSLELERAAITRLAPLKSTKNLIDIFLATRSGVRKGASTKAQRTAVIGAGVMGAGIAQWISSRGNPVTLCDIGDDRVAAGLATAEKLYRKAVDHHILTKLEARDGMDRIYPDSRGASFANHDIVIEAAVEEMELKRTIFKNLDARAGKDTILATNTSALSITQIANATCRADKVIGLHFFNPVHRMKLVEVVAGEMTSADTIKRTLEFVRGIGKMPILVNDSPGFLVNRILMPYLIEAARMVDMGAEPEFIDEAMVAFGMPMGPLRLVDEVGVDVASHVAATLHDAFGDRLAPPEILQHMLATGIYGRKCGEGFYLYETKHHKVNPDLHDFRRGQHSHLPAAGIQMRLAALMIDEAARCLEEDVVNDPAEVDFAMIMGTGFAPFHGGPLRLADTLGAHVVIAALEDAGRQPSDLLEHHASANTKFYPTSKTL